MTMPSFAFAVLAATDLTEPADEAVRQAHAFAQATGSRLGVCHVVSNASVSVAADEVRGRVRFLTGLGDADYDLFIERGSAYAAVIRRAEEWRASRIFVGSHGHGGVKERILGGVAEKIVRYAHCAVLVARCSPDGGCVLAATDLSDPSMPAIAAAVVEAQRLAAPLIALHAIDFATAAYLTEVGSFFGAVSISPEVQNSPELRGVLTETLRGAIERFGGRGDAVVVDGPAADATARAARECSARLVVVGTHGRTGVLRIALGSVAEKIVRIAPCSVLVVRAPAHPA